MKTGKWKGFISINVKVEAGVSEPYAFSNKGEHELLNALKASLEALGKTYEEEILTKILAQLGEPDEYLTPPNLDLTHRPVDWRPLPPSEWGQDEVESMVKDLQGARRQLKSILNLSEEDSSDVILKGIHHAAEEALAYIGDDK